MFSANPCNVNELEQVWNVRTNNHDKYEGYIPDQYLHEDEETGVLFSPESYFHTIK
jgi:hypothetical protein